jgi:hypothetical protein
MSVDGTHSRGNPNQALLCWSEAPHSPSREEFVQVLESHLSEAVIQSARRVSEETKVRLIGKDYTGIGIVKSCRKEGHSFILNIWIGDEESSLPPFPAKDPGILSVENFLTEEEEAKILEELEDWTSRFQVVSPVLGFV